MGDYSGNKAATFQVVPSTFAEALVAVAPIADQKWTGDSLEPALVLTNFAGVELVKGKDYLVKYENNIAVGSTAKVTVVGWGSYAGSAPLTADFQIVKADNPMAAKAKASKFTLTFKAAKQTIAASKLYAVSNAQGEVTYAKASVAGKSTKAKNAGKITVDAKGNIAVAASTPADTYTVKVKVTAAGNGNYNAKTATLTYAVTVNKAANPLVTKAAKASLKAADLKKAAKTVAPAVVKTKGQGTVTYSKKSGSANFTVNAKTGKITAKKGTAKGTYKIVLNVKAAGNANYKAATKTATVTITVK